jgi:lysophospholipase L1-like esterase
MTRFVALGDSITVGMGDPVAPRSGTEFGIPDSSADLNGQTTGGQLWRGWAALLAEGLGSRGQVEYHNFAELGAQSHTLAATQLPAALDLRPDVAAVIIGVNDTLRGSFQIGRTAEALDRTIGALRAGGAQVLTATLPDPGMMLRLPKALARPLARRIRAVNAVTTQLSQRYDTVLADLCSWPDLYDRRLWSVDRLHPSEVGHRRLARFYADLLVQRGFPVTGLPSTVPTSPSPTRLASVRWMATKGTRWVLHRSTDLVPALIGLWAVEWWHGLTGLASRLDRRLAEEVVRVLQTRDSSRGATLPGPVLNESSVPAPVLSGSRFPAAVLSGLSLPAPVSGLSLPAPVSGLSLPAPAASVVPPAQAETVEAGVLAASDPVWT